MAEILSNLIKNVDPSLKEILLFLIKENEEKTTQLQSLTSEVQELRQKTNELERYNSKDTIIIHNLPLRSQRNIMEDVILFLKSTMQVYLQAEEIKACHPLGPVKDVNNPPPIIVKFIYFNDKFRVWSRKALVRNFRHPTNQRSVYIYERLSKYDMALKEAAEKQEMIVNTWNSAPVVKINNDGQIKDMKLNSEKDIEELAPIAVKRKQKPTGSYPTGPNTNVLQSHNKRLLEITPTKPMNKGMDEFLLELKKRSNNDSDLIDYVKGFLSDSPLNKHHCERPSTTENLE